MSHNARSTPVLCYVASTGAENTSRLYLQAVNCTVEMSGKSHN